MFIVTLKSGEGHYFEFTTEESNKDLAIQRTFDKIKELCYDIYDYQLINVVSAD